MELGFYLFSLPVASRSATRNSSKFPRSRRDLIRSFRTFDRSTHIAFGVGRGTTIRRTCKTRVQAKQKKSMTSPCLVPLYFAWHCNLPHLPQLSQCHIRLLPGTYSGPGCISSHMKRHTVTLCRDIKPSKAAS